MIHGTMYCAHNTPPEHMHRIVQSICEDKGDWMECPTCHAKTTKIHSMAPSEYKLVLKALRAAKAVSSHLAAYPVSDPEFHVLGLSKALRDLPQVVQTDLSEEKTCPQQQK